MSSDMIAATVTPNCRVVADNYQWIIQTRGDDAKLWKSRFYVATSKEVLLRTLKEMGIEPDPLGDTDLIDLPGTFKEWLANNKGEEDDKKNPDG